MKNTKRNNAKPTIVRSINSRSTTSKKELEEKYFANAAHVCVALDQVDDSPFNRRKFFNKRKMKELVASIKECGVLQDICVRPLPSGRFELVFGHRRLTAARLAGLTTLNVKSAPLPDAEVKKIMLTENLHHEAQHAMDQAYSIDLMLQDSKTIKEIALQLGKSETFVTGRIKLLSLIEELQDMFYQDKFTLQNALLLSTISADSQTELYNTHCTNWKDEAGFELTDIEYLIRNYQYDLTNAPFDIKAKKLVEGKGACTSCEFNTATQTLLFPLEAKQASCKNKTCFESKCTAHYQMNVLAAAAAVEPAALILSGGLSESVLKVLQALPVTKDLPRYDRTSIQPVTPPPAPERKDFEFDGENESQPCFDEAAFQLALDEHAENEKEFTRLLSDGTIIKGLLITNHECQQCYFSKGALKIAKQAAKVTSKQVQQAIKEGVETPDMLQQEVDKLEKRIHDLREQATTDIFTLTHSAYKAHVSQFTNNRQLTEADTAAIRILVYLYLPKATQNTVNSKLGFASQANAQTLFEGFQKMSSFQFAYLIRMALADAPGSNQKDTLAGICLEALAKSAGVDCTSIQKNVDADTHRKIETIEQRIQVLNNRKADLAKDAA